MVIRLSKLVLEILLSVAVIVAAAAAIFAWRLSAGPIPLGFLSPVIERALNDEVPGARITFDETVLAWTGWERNLDLQVLNVTISSGEGSMVARIPELDLSLSATALLRGIVAPVAIEVRRPRLTIIRTKEGEIRFGADAAAGGPQSAEEAGRAIPLMIGGFLKEQDPGGAGGYLRQISITDGVTTIYDLADGRTWSIPDTDATLFRNPAGLRADLGLTVKMEDSEARLAAHVSYSTGADRIEGQVRFSDVGLAHLRLVDRRLARLSIIETTVSGIVDLAMELDGRVRSVGFSLAGPKGRIVLPEFFPEPISFRQVRLVGEFFEDAKRLKIVEAALDLGVTKIEASADIDGLDDRPRLSATAMVRRVFVDDVRRLWPINIAANPRRWIIENLSKGVLEEGRFEVSAAAASDGGAAFAPERIDGTFRFSGLTVQYLKGLPPVENVAGAGRVGIDRVDLEANAGELGQLKVDRAKIALTDFDRDVELASIDVSVRGPLREALELVDRQPLGFVKAIGQTPVDFDGNAAVRILFKFPLLDRLKVEEIDMAVTANVSEFGLRNVVLDQDARDGALAMRLTNKGLDIQGALTVGQVRAEIEMTRTFSAGAQLVAETKARGTFSSADRAAFGFDIQPVVDGPVDVVLAYIERRGGHSQLAADLKLDAATLAIREQDWSKPPGIPASARLEMRLDNGRPVDLPVLRASGGGLQVNGRGAFSRDGKTLARIDVDALKVGLTDVRGSFARGPEGISIDIEGRAFNGEPFMRDRGSGAGGARPAAGRPGLRVVARVDRLYLAPDRFFDQLNLDGHRSPRRWERIDLKAQTPVAAGASRPAAIDLKTDAAGRQTLFAHADDAGALLKIVGATPNVVGGKLELKGATDESISGAPLVGNVDMSQFRLVQAPALARVLSIALLTGLLDSLKGEGIGFTRLAGEFEAYDSQIKIRDARAYGSAVGITAKGTLDTEAETVELSGTLVPAYALNSVLGNIPLLGRILVPERGGGLFAANYKISGPAADPSVTVNPLSTLAPGFLRGLFDISEDGKGPPPNFDADPNQRRDGQ